jgi:hypothetical protein
MTDLIQHLIDEPVANLIVLAGVVFLFIAAVGKVSGKIEPDARGRIACGILGLLLLPTGLIMHGFQDSGKQTSQVTPQSTSQPVVSSAASTVLPAQTSSPASASALAKPREGLCKPGYVWRLAVPDDHVCVTEETRTKVAVDNQLATSRIANSGQYGADTCRQGFVWREAVPADHICVTPETRDLTRQDNGLALTRVEP